MLSASPTSTCKSRSPTRPRPESKKPSLSLAFPCRCAVNEKSRSWLKLHRVCSSSINAGVLLNTINNVDWKIDDAWVKNFTSNGMSSRRLPFFSRFTSPTVKIYKSQTRKISVDMIAEDEEEVPSTWLESEKRKKSSVANWEKNRKNFFRLRHFTAARGHG